MAALDLLHHFRKIQEHMNKKEHNGLAAIVMDGENAWEYYQDNGRLFFETLYSQLDGGDNIRTTTVSNYLKRERPKKILTKIIKFFVFHFIFSSPILQI